MIPFWNSIKYDNLSDLATQLRVKGTCRLSTKIVNLEKIGMKMPYNNIIRLKLPYSFANKVPSDRDTKTIHYTGYYIKNVGEGKEVISKSEEHEKMIVLC